MPSQRPLLEVDEDSLPEAYRHALAERQQGQDFIFCLLEPHGPTSKYMELWEQIVGEVVGRKFYEEYDGPDADTVTKPIAPDLSVRRTTKYLIIRVRIADVCEAMRRHATREAREDVAPIPANAPRTTRVTTSR
jgi:hypothetical protein